jgi:hypothetical protein
VLSRTWAYRTLLLAEAATFAIAAAIHFGALLDGYEHTAAGRAETVIAIVLIAGVVLSFTRRGFAAIIGAQAFGTLGVLVGLFTIAVGAGPRTALDLAYHAVILTVLAGALVAALRTRRCRIGNAPRHGPDMIRRCTTSSSSERASAG